MISQLIRVKRGLLLRVFLSFTVCLAFGMSAVEGAAARQVVNWTGFYTVDFNDKYSDELQNELLERLKLKCGILPFAINFISNEGTQENKMDLDNSLGMAVIIDRSDVITESFYGLGINKYIINCGMTVVVFAEEVDNQAGRETKKRQIIYSVPVVGYSEIKATEQLTDRQINEKYLSQTALITLDNLVNAMAKTSIDFIKSTESVTYQVVDCSFASQSQKAKQVFPEEQERERICTQVADWLTGYLAERSGKVFLPSKLGSQWSEKAGDRMAMLVFNNSTGEQTEWEMLKPKYQVNVEITGLNKMIMKESNANKIVLYKSWLKVTIPTKGEKEFDKVIAKSDVGQLKDKDIFFELLWELTKVAGQKSF